MKRIFLFSTVFMVFTLLSITSSGQITLKIIIRDLSNNTGVVQLDFRDGNDNAIIDARKEITNNTCVFWIKNLKPGKYSFKYFHDENENYELDTYWIGAPKEGYGFSNNASGTFGPPSFEKTVFELENSTVMVCYPKYIYL